MKPCVVVLILILFGCSSIDIETVQIRPDGLTYYKGTNRLVDGAVTRRFDNGQIAEKINYRGGKQIGTWNSYDHSGNDFTHGYGFALDQNIVNAHRKLNLSNVTLSINVEGDYRYASLALPDSISELGIDELLQLRNLIFVEYNERHRFEDVFIELKSTQYRFGSSDYSAQISLDTVKAPDGFIVNVR